MVEYLTARGAMIYEWQIEREFKYIHGQPWFGMEQIYLQQTTCVHLIATRCQCSLRSAVPTLQIAERKSCSAGTGKLFDFVHPMGCWWMRPKDRSWWWQPRVETLCRWNAKWSARGWIYKKPTMKELYIDRTDNLFTHVCVCWITDRISFRPGGLFWPMQQYLSMFENLLTQGAETSIKPEDADFIETLLQLREEWIALLISLSSRRHLPQAAIRMIHEFVIGDAFMKIGPMMRHDVHRNFHFTCGIT